MTHHRSNHLAGDAGSVRLSASRTTALLILPAIVYGYLEKSPSELATVESVMDEQGTWLGTKTHISQKLGNVGHLRLKQTPFS